MSDLEGEGVSITLPRGWEGRIAGRAPEAPPSAAAAAEEQGRVEAPTTVVAHFANFPLPADMGDFGGGVVDTMTSRDVFAVLFEYGPESVGTALFASQGLPRLRAKDFHPGALRTMINGQSGVQRFFELDGRAFCLYAVLGSHARRIGLVPLVAQVVEGIRVT